MVQYKAIEDSARKTSIFMRFYSTDYTFQPKKIEKYFKHCIFMLYHNFYVAQAPGVSAKPKLNETNQTQFYYEKKYARTSELTEYVWSRPGPKNRNR